VGNIHVVLMMKGTETYSNRVGCFLFETQLQNRQTVCKI